MKLRFSKMHGLGNDFIVIDAISQNVSLTPDKIHLLANRHLGIGCDQILMIEPSNKNGVDFHYRIFNADGSESMQCGNGLRCIARFIERQGLSKNKELRVATDISEYVLILKADDEVKVNVNKPIFNPAAIPFDAEQEDEQYSLTTSKNDFKASVLSVGNPHCILQVLDVDNVDLAKIGYELSHHPRFPKQSNVEFVQVIDHQHIKLRIYERGVGETQACGSGACAAMVACHRLGLVDDTVQMMMPGGNLTISWQGNDNDIWMQGPATFVFEGEMEI